MPGSTSPPPPPKRPEAPRAARQGPHATSEASCWSSGESRGVSRELRGVCPRHTSIALFLASSASFSLSRSWKTFSAISRSCSPLSLDSISMRMRSASLLSTWRWLESKSDDEAPSSARRAAGGCGRDRPKLGSSPPPPLSDRTLPRTRGVRRRRSCPPRGRARESAPRPRKNPSGLDCLGIFGTLRGGLSLCRNDIRRPRPAWLVDRRAGESAPLDPPRLSPRARATRVAAIPELSRVLGRATSCQGRPKHPRGPRVGWSSGDG